MRDTLARRWDACQILKNWELGVCEQLLTIDKNENWWDYSKFIRKAIFKEGRSSNVFWARNQTATVDVRETCNIVSIGSITLTMTSGEARPVKEVKSHDAVPLKVDETGDKYGMDSRTQRWQQRNLTSDTTVWLQTSRWYVGALSLYNPTAHS